MIDGIIDKEQSHPFAILYIDTNKQTNFTPQFIDLNRVTKWSGFPVPSYTGTWFPVPGLIVDLLSLFKVACFGK